MLNITWKNKTKTIAIPTATADPMRTITEGTEDLDGSTEGWRETEKMEDWREEGMVTEVGEGGNGERE